MSSKLSIINRRIDEVISFEIDGERSYKTKFPSNCSTTGSVNSLVLFYPYSIFEDYYENTMLAPFMETLRNLCDELSYVHVFNYVKISSLLVNAAEEINRHTSRARKLEQKYNSFTRAILAESNRDKNLIEMKSDGLNSAAYNIIYTDEEGNRVEAFVNLPTGEVDCTYK